MHFEATMPQRSEQHFKFKQEYTMCVKSDFQKH